MNKIITHQEFVSGVMASRANHGRLNIFIGYDPKETVAYHVLADSLMRHASGPLSITPLIQKQLRKAGLYWRDRDVLSSTEFSLTRFLVPCLSDYKGVSIFMDCDMLCQADPYELLELAQQDVRTACSIVKHDYVPSTTLKMDHQVQTMYPRKNWSSLMVFNNAQCHALSPHYVNTVSPAVLHRFAWMANEHLGSLPLTWNWLVGEYEPNIDAKLLHYTLGGPWFSGRDCGSEGALWREAYTNMTLSEEIVRG